MQGILAHNVNFVLLSLVSNWTIQGLILFLNKLILLYYN